ncbi:hypothetical protein KK083_24850 [Fulvivirgaceae bacterium PWU4]|uniref:Adhesin domain-containing protein n=1 Tax=Chryseosolibacter histidini TaxID=2782349 RepID=A0AAP2DPG1_9BACT|nr:DUF4097 domain-containing protein [Chryseosolibacter histidini]MBT1700141.1 hypothetical protein [Chryseosolibacter histidini]
MKLSNKILLGFFGFIFLYLTAVFAELRLTGIPNIMDDKNSIAETADISGITYLVLSDCNKEVKVIGSDQPRLEVRSFSGALLNKLKYGISGDTLTLSGFQSDISGTVGISVFVPRTGLKGITVKSTSGTIEGLQQESLQLSQNSGRIWMEDNKISNIQTDLSNGSTLSISKTPLDTLSARIDGSRLHVLAPVGLVQGTIENNSRLQLSELQEIQVKKDKNSHLFMYQ